MGLNEILAVFLVVMVCGLLMTGYPVALTLGGASVLVALLGEATGTMSPGLLRALPQRISGVMSNDVLLAIPLFIFMGVMLERSRIAEDLLESMGRMFGSVRGGLGLSVTVVGALLAASTGVVGATAVTMGLVMLPAMLRHGYDPRLAAGTVAASATLAQIIPPSTVLVLLGDQLNTAYQAAQLASGVFAPNSVSVGDLFAAAILPGLCLVGLYQAYVIAVAVLYPKAAPAVAGVPERAHFASTLQSLIAPVLLIVAVLGSILAGLATPTEAAGVGAVGAIVLAALRVPGNRWAVGVVPVAVGGLLLVAAVGRLTAPPTHAGLFALAAMFGLAALAGVAVTLLKLWRAGLLQPVMVSTTQVTSMIFVILLGATVFSLVFRGLGGEDLVHRWLGDLPGGTAGAILVVMLAMFLLGFVMDAFEIIFVIVPIVGPALLKMPGVDPVWLGILMAVNLQTSYIHPPLGPTLFFLRGVAPPEITTRHIYVGIIPFVVIQLFMLLVLWFVPGLATWLPRTLYGSP